MLGFRQPAKTKMPPYIDTAERSSIFLSLGIVASILELMHFRLNDGFGPINPKLTISTKRKEQHGSSSTS